MNTKGFLRVWFAALLSLFISAWMSSATMASEMALLPERPSDGDLIDPQVRAIQLGSAVLEFQDLSVSATVGNTGFGWYQNEYSCLLSLAQGRRYTILIGLLGGNYPASILAADQQALGLADLFLETLGYTQVNLDWEYPGSDTSQKDSVRYQNRYEPK